MRLTGLVVAAVALFASLAAADEPAPETTAELEGLLDEPVVTTASQAPEAASIAPAVSTSISAEDLRRYGIRSLDEAINYLSLGMITQNPLHSVDIGAQGVLLTSDFGNHVLLLVDGHTMNEPWDGTAYFERGAAIPLELVDHIEIILGPGSVLYGSNAMLGVINIVTRRAKDWSGLHVVAESELPISIRGAVGFGDDFRLFGQRAELVGAMEVYHQAGPAFRFASERYGNDAVTGMPKKFSPSGDNAGVWGGTADRSYHTDVASGHARLRVGRFELEVHASRYRRATPYSNDFNQSAVDFNDPDSWERDTQISADLRHDVALSTVATLRSRLYGDVYRYVQQVRSSAAEDCSDGQTSGCIRHSVGRSRWAGLDEQLALDWHRDASLVTLLGADGRVRHYASGLDLVDRATGDNPGAIGEVARTELAVGLYVQQTLRPLRWMDFNAGVRLDADQRFGTALSPRAAVAARLWTGGTAKLVYAEAFRAPTGYELYFADPTSQIAAPDLRPETVRGVEAMVAQRVGTQRLFAGVFRSRWSGIVLLDSLSEAEVQASKNRGQLSPVTIAAAQYRNVSSLSNKGINLGFEGTVRAGDVRYGMNLTLATSSRITGGAAQPLTVGPEVFGNAHVAWQLAAPLPTVAVAVLAQGARAADRAFDGSFTPVPWVPAQITARLALTGPVPRLPRLSFRFTFDASSGSASPYVVGPVQTATPLQPSAQLAPVDRYRAGFGLQLDL